MFIILLFIITILLSYLDTIKYHYNNEPPATPEAPQALTADSKLSTIAIPIST